MRLHKQELTYAGQPLQRGLKLLTATDQNTQKKGSELCGGNRTFCVRAGIAVPHVYTDGRGVEAQDSVEALQPLLQAGVWAKEVLKKSWILNLAWDLWGWGLEVRPG